MHFALHIHQVEIQIGKNVKRKDILLFLMNVIINMFLYVSDYSYTEKNITRK